MSITESKPGLTPKLFRRRSRQRMGVVPLDALRAPFDGAQTLPHATCKVGRSLQKGCASGKDIVADRRKRVKKRRRTVHRH